MPFSEKQTKYDALHNPYEKPQWRDPFFLFLFVGMLGALTATSIMYMPNVNWESDDAAADALTFSDYDSFIYVALAQAALAVASSLVVLLFCVKFPKTLIKTCLIIQICLCAASCIFAFAYSAWVPGIVMLLFTAIYVWYYFAVQSRIPFATANLKIGVTSLRMNMGIVLFAFTIMLTQFAFTIWWALDYYGIQQTFFPCDDNGNCENINGGVVFGMLLAFFWAAQVFMNVTHVATCGTTASWWFQPQLSGSFCSPAVTGSIKRATTTSLGSICFGSLLVAIISTLRAMAENQNSGGDGDLLTCCIVCLLRCLEDILEYFNKWAFVYVAVYGDSYITSGKSVMNLFKNRGWTALITDQLVGNVISVMSLVIGLICGALGYIAYQISPDSFVRVDEGAQWILLGVGFLLGLTLSMVFLRPVMSVVDTVFVCYADAPRELMAHHPGLYTELTTAWTIFRPGFDDSFDNSTEKHDERGGGGRGGNDQYAGGTF